MVTDQQWMQFIIGNYYTYPVDCQECLVLLRNGEIWHCKFDGYSDDWRSPPYVFRSVARVGVVGNSFSIAFDDEVVAWKGINNKEILKVYNGA